jgi:hypothetical protein
MQAIEMLAAEAAEMAAEAAEKTSADVPVAPMPAEATWPRQGIEDVRRPMCLWCPS